MQPAIPTLLLALPLALASGCGAPTAKENAIGDEADGEAHQRDLQSRLAAVARDLAAGDATPSDVLSSSEFRPLRDDPVTRRASRRLLAEHALSPAITMVDREEPGVPLRLEIRTVDANSGRPLAAVAVELVHVDDNGLYQPSDLDAERFDWNPRLFGHCTTGADGKVIVRTIRPAHYHPHYESEEPAHVHFTLTRDGYRPWGGEIFFEDDERLDTEARAEARRTGTPIASAVRGPDGVVRASVTLRVQPLD